MKLFVVLLLATYAAAQAANDEGIPPPPDTPPKPDAPATQGMDIPPPDKPEPPAARAKSSVSQIDTTAEEPAKRHGKKHHNKKSHSKRHNSKHHSIKHHRMTSRAMKERGLFSNTCDFVCGSTGGNDVTVQKSWQIDLRSNEAIGLLIVYEGNTNSMAFINYEKEVAIIFTGNKEIFGIFHFKANVGLVINKSNGIAKYVTTTDNHNLFVGENANVYSGVFSYANVIFTNQKDITGVFSGLTLNKSTFNFKKYMDKVISGSSSFFDNFFGKNELYDQVQQNFSGLFNSISDKVSSGFNFEFGILNALVGVLGNVDGYSYGVLLIVSKFASSDDGFSNGALLYQLNSQLSLYVEGFQNGSITTVVLTADMSLSFYATTKALFTITINGYIMVDGAIKGSVENAESIVGGMLGSFSIGVGVEFQIDVTTSFGAVVQAS